VLFLLPLGRYRTAVSYLADLKFGLETRLVRSCKAANDKQAAVKCLKLLKQFIDANLADVLKL
jgi:hypothetical protein